MNLMKSNYDTQIKDIIANAERNLKTIKTMKTKLDGPINDVLDQINTLQFQFTTENKKNQFEIDEQRQKIDQLNQEIKKLRRNGGVDLDEIDRNEKRLLKELKVVNKENKQMKEAIQEFKEEVDYCKQRENKLMYFLYVMKEKGLPVGEIFEEEIKEIPTKRFSKYFDDESRDEREKEETRKLMSLSERIFPVSREQVISDTTSIMNITDGPPMKQKRFSIVPELRLDGLPPRHIHYFSDDSERSGYDLSIERRKFNENATVSQKYNLASYGKRMKQEKLHRKASEDSFQKSKILQLGKSGSADVWLYPTEESLLNYEGFIIGPEGSPFEGGMFNVNITIPNDYPFKPPKLVFTTKIFHPSIDFNTGFISMDILYDQWSPAITVPNVLKLIRDFMACPIGDLFQNMEAKCLYHFDYPRYLEVAKYYTQEYA